MSALLRAMGGLGVSGGNVSLRLMIHYYADPGSYLAVVGLDSEDPGKEMLMEHHGDGHWVASVEVSLARAKQTSNLVSYKYVVCWPHKKRYEAIQTRRFMSLEGVKPGSVITCKDSFRAPNSNVFVTTAFTDAIFGPHGIRKEDSMLGDKSLANNWTKRPNGPSEDNDVIAVRFVLLVPRLLFGHTVHITGSGDILGNYNPEKKVHMLNLGQHLYGAVVYFKKTDFPVEYKYCIYDEKDNLMVRERYDPRRLELVKDQACRYVNLDEFFSYEKEWKGAGVAIPVASLRTSTSMGIGDFTDIKILIDWAKKAGLHLIQVLPVNDTGNDPSPYSANSVFALHPVYLNVKRVANEVFGEEIPTDIRNEINQAIVELNANTKIDYQHSLSWKLHLLEKIFKLCEKQTFSAVGFQEWFATNMDWLAPYACWKSILEKTGEWDFHKWDTTVENMTDLIDKKSPYYERICFMYFIQYHLHLQLKDASQYASKNGIALKGDLPIGVARFSADTWTSPQIFKMDWSAGAPPNGPPPAQNWDFPLYNWEVMADDGYSWWKKRLSQMSEYFHAFRIDHVLGFFRIWAIPQHNYSGVLGHLEPCKPVTIDELKQIGIEKDLDRLLLPYVTPAILKERFGEDEKPILKKFFAESNGAILRFKPEYSTQAAIAEGLKGEDGSSFKNSIEKIKKGLFELIDDRLMLRDETDPNKFYFTCHLHFTRSFAEFTPEDKKHRMGQLQHDFFWVRQNWRSQGTERLGAIQGAAKMMVCAEDLGHVPPETFEVLDELGILGLRIQRWPSHGNFGDPAQYGYLTVASPSCHDCSTVRGWWEEDRWRAHELFRAFFGGNPPHNCEDWVSQKVVESHLRGNSMWAIFPLQDLLDMWGELRSRNPSEDAINRPGSQDGVWVYRMPMTVESLVGKEHFNKFLRNLIERTGRASTY